MLYLTKESWSTAYPSQVSSVLHKRASQAAQELAEVLHGKLHTKGPVSKHANASTCSSA